ncbi:MAG: hypothetical protein ACSHX4_06520 [Opitutaceae bacterium]
MKTILLTILSALCFIFAGCNKNSTEATMVETKVVFSHPNQFSGGGEMTRRQELGTISNKTPSTGQIISLTDKKEVSISQSTDASDPSMILVTLESEMDGFPLETQVLEFDSSAPHPPAAKFKNGLTAAVSVNTYTK